LRCLNNVSSRKLVAVWQTMITEHNDNSRSCCCRSSSIILLPFPGSAGDFCITLLRLVTAPPLTTILSCHVGKFDCQLSEPSKNIVCLRCYLNFSKDVRNCSLFAGSPDLVMIWFQIRAFKDPRLNNLVGINLIYFGVGLPSPSLAVGFRLNLLEAYFRES